MLRTNWTCPPFSIPDAFWPLLDAACAGEISEQQRLELEGHLESNPAARRAFLDHIGLCTQIRLWQKGQRSLQAGLAEIDLERLHVSDQQSAVSNQPAAISAPSAAVPPIVIHVSPPVSAPLSALFAPGGWAFSYATAMAITGVMLLVLWGWKVSHEGDLAQAPPAQVPPLQQNIESQVELVGRISGTADCRWADPPDGAAVRLGGKYVLNSGLVEITYQSGATVILEGPCAYEVDSPAGGFLSLGKLTARVEKLSAISDQLSEISKSPNLQISKFVVRTPTAVVTDVGTEFGVEVDASGTSRAHVFRGRVEVRPADADAATGRVPVISLGENESATVRVGKDSVPAMTREPGQPGKFARGMPRRVPIKVFNTGVGLKEGDPDPHWQLVARSDDPHLKPRPAVVTLIDPRHFQSNDPTRLQWISTAGDLPKVPDGVTYTFRTTFELVDAVPGSAVMQGGFTPTTTWTPSASTVDRHRSPNTGTTPPSANSTGSRSTRVLSRGPTCWRSKYSTETRRPLRRVASVRWPSAWYSRERRSRGGANRLPAVSADTRAGKPEKGDQPMNGP